MRTVKLLLAHYRLAYYRLAMEHMSPSHPDMPAVVLRISELEDLVR